MAPSTDSQQVPNQINSAHLANLDQATDNNELATRIRRRYGFLSGQDAGSPGQNLMRQIASRSVGTHSLLKALQRRWLRPGQLIQFQNMEMPFVLPGRGTRVGSPAAGVSDHSPDDRLVVRASPTQLSPQTNLANPSDYQSVSSRTSTRDITGAIRRWPADVQLRDVASKFPDSSAIQVSGTGHPNMISQPHIPESASVRLRYDDVASSQTATLAVGSERDLNREVYPHRVSGRTVAADTSNEVSTAIMRRHMGGILMRSLRQRSQGHHEVYRSSRQDTPPVEHQSHAFSTGHGRMRTEKARPLHPQANDSYIDQAASLHPDVGAPLLSRPVDSLTRFQKTSASLMTQPIAGAELATPFPVVRRLMRAQGGAVTHQRPIVIRSAADADTSVIGKVSPKSTDQMTLQRANDLRNQDSARENLTVRGSAVSSGSDHRSLIRAQPATVHNRSSDPASDLISRSVPDRTLSSIRADTPDVGSRADSVSGLSSSSPSVVSSASENEPSIYLETPIIASAPYHADTSQHVSSGLERAIVSHAMPSAVQVQRFVTSGIRSMSMTLTQRRSVLNRVSANAPIANDATPQRVEMRTGSSGAPRPVDPSLRVTAVPTAQSSMIEESSSNWPAATGQEAPVAHAERPHQSVSAKRLQRQEANESTYHDATPGLEGQPIPSQVSTGLTPLSRVTIFRYPDPMTGAVRGSATQPASLSHTLLQTASARPRPLAHVSSQADNSRYSIEGPVSTPAAKTVSSIIAQRKPGGVRQVHGDGSASSTDGTLQQADGDRLKRRQIIFSGQRTVLGSSRHDAETIHRFQPDAVPSRSILLMRNDAGRSSPKPVAGVAVSNWGKQGAGASKPGTVVVQRSVRFANSGPSPDEGGLLEQNRAQGPAFGTPLRDSQPEPVSRSMVAKAHVQPARVGGRSGSTELARSMVHLSSAPTLPIIERSQNVSGTSVSRRQGPVLDRTSATVSIGRVGNRMSWNRNRAGEGPTVINRLSKPAGLGGNDADPGSLPDQSIMRSPNTVSAQISRGSSFSELIVQPKGYGRGLPTAPPAQTTGDNSSSMQIARGEADLPDVIRTMSFPLATAGHRQMRSVNGPAADRQIPSISQTGTPLTTYSFESTFGGSGQAPALPAPSIQRAEAELSSDLSSSDSGSSHATATSPAGSSSSTISDAEMQRIADEVYDIIERRLMIERESMGL